MISTEDFLGIVSDRKDTSVVRLGTVSAVNGKTATITFDGETNPSNKAYKTLDSYTPLAGDTVLLIAVSSTYIILGKIAR